MKTNPFPTTTTPTTTTTRQMNSDNHQEAKGNHYTSENDNKTLMGQSLLSYCQQKENEQEQGNGSIGLTSLDDLAVHDRFAFLSHATQADPIYCLVNVAACRMFQYTEEEMYQLPSRYSAPESVRSQRQAFVQTAQTEGVFLFPESIRQTKHGTLFRIRDIVVWNVQDEQGYRVGQAAIYDADKVVFSNETTNTTTSTTTDS
ncbi:hypothetical protein ACA910_005662 [Epithemia clementina (nom. ined.)]